MPSGQLKKDLLENLDNVPLNVQELMFTVKNSTIGTAATFTKVDMVIKQSRGLLTFVQNTSHLSIQCAKRVRQSGSFCFILFASFYQTETISSFFFYFILFQLQYTLYSMQCIHYTVYFRKLDDRSLLEGNN